MYEFHFRSGMSLSPDRCSRHKFIVIGENSGSKEIKCRYIDLFNHICVILYSITFCHLSIYQSICIHMKGRSKNGVFKNMSWWILDIQLWIFLFTVWLIRFFFYDLSTFYILQYCFQFSFIYLFWISCMKYFSFVWI